MKRYSIEIRTFSGAAHDALLDLVVAACAHLAAKGVECVVITSDDDVSEARPAPAAAGPSVARAKAN